MGPEGVNRLPAAGCISWHSPMSLAPSSPQWALARKPGSLPGDFPHIQPQLWRSHQSARACARVCVCVHGSVMCCQGTAIMLHRVTSGLLFTSGVGLQSLHAAFSQQGRWETPSICMEAIRAAQHTHTHTLALKLTIGLNETVIFCMATERRRPVVAVFSHIHHHKVPPS